MADTRQARYSVATLLTREERPQMVVGKSTKIDGATTPCRGSAKRKRQIPVAVKIGLDHMFDHLRIFLCFYVLRIAGFLQKIKNSFSLFTAYQILMADEINRQPSLNVKTAVLLINIHTNTCLFALALFPRQIYPQQYAIRIFRSVFRKQ